MRRPAGWLLLLYVAASACGGARYPSNFVAGKLIRLNDNGAWSWFMDERAIVHEGKLLVGSVRSVDRPQADPTGGRVEVATLDLASGTARRAVLHRFPEQDDHNAPALLALPGGRFLAVFTRHGGERLVYIRGSEPRDPVSWAPVKTFETPGKDAVFGVDNTTYSNVFRLRSGRVVNFFRGFDQDPNYMYSDDSGRTWRYGGRLLHGRDGYAPYLKYAYDGRSTIHFVATEDHPRNFDNSIYHGFIRGNGVYGSDGALRGKLSSTTDVRLNAWDMTRVFRGDPDHVAWMVDVELDAQGRPCVLFSVQRDGRGRPLGSGGLDLRYYYARRDGSRWSVHEAAHAGGRLYQGEDDYSGLGAIDPNDPNIVYVSTDADPISGKPLESSADGIRHYELYRGTTSDLGSTWNWEPITANSTVDNLRPIVPRWRDRRTALVWMRGAYDNAQSWRTAVVATILGRRP